MPGLVANIRTSVVDADLDVRIGGDIGRLIEAGELLVSLAQDPPSDLGDLAGALASIDLPVPGGADGVCAGPVAKTKGARRRPVASLSRRSLRASNSG